MLKKGWSRSSSSSSSTYGNWWNTNFWICDERKMRTRKPHDLFAIDLHRSANLSSRTDGEQNGYESNEIYGLFSVRTYQILCNRQTTVCVYVCLCLLRTCTHKWTLFACTQSSNIHSKLDAAATATTTTTIQRNAKQFSKHKSTIFAFTSRSTTHENFQHSRYSCFVCIEMLREWYNTTTIYTLCVIKCTRLASTNGREREDERRKDLNDDYDDDKNNNGSNNSSNPWVWYVWLVCISCCAVSYVQMWRIIIIVATTTTTTTKACVCVCVYIELCTQRSAIPSTQSALVCVLCYGMVCMCASISFAKVYSYIFITFVRR